MTFGQTIYCVAMGVLAFAGLLLASRAGDAAYGYVGLALAVFAVANIFVLVHRTTGGPRP